MAQADGIIANVVRPIVSIPRVSANEVTLRLADTAFLIGVDGWEMTAGHFANVLDGESPAIMFRGADDKWELAKVREADVHPTQDLAMLKLEPGAYPPHRSH